MRYESYFESNNSLKRDYSKTNTEKNQEKRSVKPMLSDNTEILESIVLLLNQVLKETADLHKKLENYTPHVALAEQVVAEPSNKRKIVLTRDASGKITGAEVLDSIVPPNVTPLQEEAE